MTLLVLQNQNFGRPKKSSCGSIVLCPVGGAFAWRAEGKCGGSMAAEELGDLGILVGGDPVDAGFRGRPPADLCVVVVAETIGADPGGAEVAVEAVEPSAVALAVHPESSGR